jgi:hypothetical protein
MNTIRLGKYKEYTGRIVNVIYIARHYKTKEKYAVYYYVGGNNALDSKKLIVTPIIKFNQKVTVREKRVNIFRQVNK